MAANFGNSAGQLFMVILTPYDTENGLIMNSALAKSPESSPALCAHPQEFKTHTDIICSRKFIFKNVFRQILSDLLLCLVAQSIEQ